MNQIKSLSLISFLILTFHLKGKRYILLTFLPMSFKIKLENISKFQQCFNSTHLVSFATKNNANSNSHDKQFCPEIHLMSQTKKSKNLKLGALFSSPNIETTITSSKTATRSSFDLNAERVLVQNVHNNSPILSSLITDNHNALRFVRVQLDMGSIY